MTTQKIATIVVKKKKKKKSFMDLILLELNIRIGVRYGKVSKQASSVQYKKKLKMKKDYARFHKHS